MPVHKLKEKEHYYLGVFLVGAYQEILGDLHNLFGDTNAVHIKVKGDEYVIDKVIEGGYEESYAAPRKSQISGRSE